MFLDIHGDSDFVFSGYVGSISFVILLESLWFLFVLHHQYLIATSCLFFFSFCLFRGRRQCVLICFPSSGTSRIYIYIFKSLTKQDKIYKKFTLLCGFVSSPLSVHQSLESLFNLFFFSRRFVLYTIDYHLYLVHFLRPTGGFRLFILSFQPIYALHSNRLN